MKTKFLLDTCTFLWLSLEPNRLSAKAKKLFRDPSNAVFLSPVSALEISHKHQIGKLPLPAKPSEFIPAERRALRVQELPVEEAACLLYERLPLHHRDPFDRLLICQALHGECSILSPDPLLRQYRASIEW